MEFGIMEMQLDQLIPTNMSDAKALQQLTNFDRSRLIQSLVDQGFSLIELGGDLGLFFPQAYRPDQIQSLLDLKEKQGLTFTVHLPLWSVEPSTPLAPVRKGSVQAIINVIKAVKPLTPEVFVLHATGALAAEFYQMKLPPAAKNLALRQFQNNAMTSIETLLKETAIPSRKLAIETIEFPLDLTLQIAEQLDLSICLDTGHVLAGFSGIMPFEEALTACLPRLAEIHLHDCPDCVKTGKLGYGKDHQPIGTGDLDVNLLLKTLDQESFHGPIIFELSVQEALQSIQRIKQNKVEK